MSPITLSAVRKENREQSIQLTDGLTFIVPNPLPVAQQVSVRSSSYTKERDIHELR